MTDTVKTWLEEAAEVTKQERQHQYGSPLINFLRIAVRWTMWLQDVLEPGSYISPVDVAWMMIDLKVARENHSSRRDNGVDLIGYASCHDVMDGHMKELGYINGVQFFDEMSFEQMCALLERLSLDSK